MYILMEIIIAYYQDEAQFDISKTLPVWIWLYSQIIERLSFLDLKTVHLKKN